MQRYRFADNFESGPSDPRWAAILGRAYGAKLRPLCMCKPAEQAAMYIAVTKTGHALKRMPNTGPQHEPRCDHYEAPAELSGLGQVAGSAIREDPEHGTIALALDFALSKGKAHAASPGEASEHDSVRADGKKLTLRATLHVLLDQAHLTRWTPRMEGKRTWNVIRRELMAAAANMVAKGLPLNDVLFIPESLYNERRFEIGARRAAKLARLNDSSASRMLLIGEMQDVKSATVGHGQFLVVEHLPDMRFRVGDDLAKRMLTRFKYQVAMNNELADVAGAHLLVVSTFSQPMQGIYDLEEACLINVDNGFIPFETMHEHQLLAALKGRRFTKALRYNLPSTAPVASVILHDTAEPTALYLIPPGAADTVSKGYADLAATSSLSAWIWNCSNGVMPPLPPIAYRAPAAGAGISPLRDAPAAVAPSAAGGSETDLDHINALAQDAAELSGDCEEVDVGLQADGLQA